MSAEFSAPDDLKPRWTIPKRRRVDGSENLHISDFVFVKDADEVLFLKSSDNYPVKFKRGKLMLPAAIVDFGEKPNEVAKRILGEQLSGAELLKPKFLTMQSYLGAHWDIVFVFEAQLEGKQKEDLKPKDPFIHTSFQKLESLPRLEIADDHLEVIDAFLKEEKDEK